MPVYLEAARRELCVLADNPVRKGHYPSTALTRLFEKWQAAKSIVYIIIFARQSDFRFYYFFRPPVVDDKQDAVARFAINASCQKRA
jgi:hypothetical protein